VGSDIQFSFSLTEQRRDPPVGELDPEFKSENCSDFVSRDILESLSKSMGVLSLSKNHDSLLMWSHYADEYSGAVIEFDSKHEFFQGQIEVDYRKNRPIKDISSYLNNNEPIPIAELCVKSEQWEYEAEVRVIRSFTDCEISDETDKFPIYTMKMPIECIKSIILGERTLLDDQKEIWELIKHTNISLSLAAIANWGYEFRPETIKISEPFPKTNPIMSPRTAHIFKNFPGELGEIACYMIEKHKLSEIANKTV
jgi:hypothetical protein